MKKFLLSFLIFLAVFCLGFFSFGLFSPVVKYETRVTVNSPVEKTFSVFINAFKLSDWIPGLKGIGWVSGNQHEPGSKWKFIITRNGTDYEMIQTLRIFSRDAQYAFLTESDMFTNEVDIRFVSSSGSTGIVATSNLEGKNIFWKSVFFFMKSSLAAQDKEMYKNLKRVVEEEA